MINQGDSIATVKTKIADALALVGVAAPTSWADATAKLNERAVAYGLDTISDRMAGGVALERINAIITLTPEAVSLFSRMTVQPDATRKAQINSLIVALKAAGVWAKLDFFYLMAMHDAQAGRLNMVANDELAAFNNPAFTVDRGYKGDGSAAYLESVFTQSGLPKAVQNNASWLLGVRQIGETSRFVIGAGSAVRFAFQGRFTGGVSVRNTQGATNDEVADVPQTGRFGSTRAGATDHRVYRNGGEVGTFLTASTAPSNQAILIFRGGTVYSSAEVTHYAAGAGLTPTEHAAADAAISTYLQSIGA